jgi:hypothetical protein
MAALDPAAVAKAYGLFKTTRMTVAAIGAAVGRSASTITRWAEQFEWGARPGAEGKPLRAPNFSRKRANRNMAKGFYQLIMRYLDTMEQGLKECSLTPEKAEQTAKLLAPLVSSYGKVDANEAADAKTKGKRSKAAGVDDVERLQREIVERLERIQSRRLAQRGSE